MEDPSQSNQAQPCRNGCGFYGSSKNDGMCSLCYKDTLQKNNSERKSPGLSHSTDASNNSSANGNSIETDGKLPATAKSPSNAANSFPKSPSSVSLPSSSPISIPTATNPSSALTSSSTQSFSADDLSTSLDSTSSSPSKSKKNRCASCRKRLGLTGFFCRCGNLYCGMHRYSDQHSCKFDYKADAQAKIRKENPVVVGEKINKI